MRLDKPAGGGILPENINPFAACVGVGADDEELIFLHGFVGCEDRK